MTFGLQDDIPARALPDAMRTLLVQQTEALAQLLQYAYATMSTLGTTGHRAAHRDGQSGSD